MSKKMRVIVDLPEDLYKQIRELAGSAENVSSFVFKEMRDSMRARAAADFQKNSVRKAIECPPNCRTLTQRVGDNLCKNCRLLSGR
jgi:hypothetical protein